MSGLFRWAGGKGRIVDALMSHIDIHRNCDLRFAPPCVGSHKAPQWIEPFVGGGAVALEAMRRSLASRYVLADGSADVMSVYKTLAQDDQALFTELRRFVALPEAEQREQFLRLKPEQDRMFPCLRALRLLILQACGFNGLYRVNKSGVYNVQFSRKATFDFNMLREAAELLRRRDVVLAAHDFAATSKPDPATSSMPTCHTWARTRPTPRRASTSRRIAAWPLRFVGLRPVALCAGCRVATARRPALCMAVSHM